MNVDLILKGGIVINQDGMGVRDVAVSQGRIVGIGAGFSGGKIVINPP